MKASVTLFFMDTGRVINVRGDVVSVAQPRLLAVRVVVKGGIGKRLAVLEVSATHQLY
jgi:hypothetical protein